MEFLHLFIWVLPDLNNAGLNESHPSIFSTILRLSSASYRSYMLLALLTLATMGLSNYAVAYLNYP